MLAVCGYVTGYKTNAITRYKTNDTMMQEGKSCWLKNIKTILEKIGMNELFPKPNTVSVTYRVLREK